MLEIKCILESTSPNHLRMRYANDDPAASLPSMQSIKLDGGGKEAQPGLSSFTSCFSFLILPTSSQPVQARPYPTRPACPGKHSYIHKGKVRGGGGPRSAQEEQTKCEGKSAQAIEYARSRCNNQKKYRTPDPYKQKQKLPLPPRQTPWSLTQKKVLLPCCGSIIHFK